MSEAVDLFRADPTRSRDAPAPGGTRPRAKSVRECAGPWSGIRDEGLRSLIASTERTLLFQRRLRTPPGPGGAPAAGSIDPALRAGLIRSELFQLGAIVEAALHAHALSRRLPKAHEARTLPALTALWRAEDPATLAPVAGDLTWMQDVADQLDQALRRTLRDGNDIGLWTLAVRGEAAIDRRADGLLAALKEFGRPGAGRAAAEVRSLYVIDLPPSDAAGPEHPAP